MNSDFDKFKNALDLYAKSTGLEYFSIFESKEEVSILTSMEAKDLVMTFYNLAKQSELFNSLIESVHFQLEKDKLLKNRIIAKLSKEIN